MLSAFIPITLVCILRSDPVILCYDSLRSLPVCLCGSNSRLPVSKCARYQSSVSLGESEPWFRPAFLSRLMKYLTTEQEETCTLQGAVCQFCTPRTPKQTGRLHIFSNPQWNQPRTLTEQRVNESVHNMAARGRPSWFFFVWFGSFTFCCPTTVPVVLWGLFATWAICPLLIEKKVSGRTMEAMAPKAGMGFERDNMTGRLDEASGKHTQGSVKSRFAVALRSANRSVGFFRFQNSKQKHKMAPQFLCRLFCHVFVFIQNHKLQDITLQEITIQLPL